MAEAKKFSYVMYNRKDQEQAHKSSSYKVEEDLLPAGIFIILSFNKSIYDHINIIIYKK